MILKDPSRAIQVLSPLHPSLLFESSSISFESSHLRVRLRRDRLCRVYGRRGEFLQIHHYIHSPRGSITGVSNMLRCLNGTAFHGYRPLKSKVMPLFHSIVLKFRSTIMLN
ncbi:hypothetical protein V2J09_008413 [Rumex salicifolius]